jgi:hypothetical protein
MDAMLQNFLFLENQFVYFALDKFVKITLSKFQSKTNSQIYPAKSIYKKFK